MAEIKTWIRNGIVATLALTGVGIAATDWVPAQASSAIPEIHTNDIIVIDRLVAEFDGARPGGIVTVRMRGKKRAEERVAKILALGGDEVSWRANKLVVNGSALTLPAKPAPSPPRRRNFKKKGLGAYVKAAVSKKSNGVPHSLGLEQERVPRHHAYVVYGDPDNSPYLRGAMVPLGDIVGVVRLALTIPEDSKELHVHGL